MQFQTQMIAGYNSGLQKSKKPFLLIDSAFQKLENAYCWRERIKKREGIKLVGRLRRVLTGESLGNTAGAQLTYNIADVFATLVITGENPQIEPGSVAITIAAPDAAAFTDNGDGTFAVTGAGVAAGSYVNYNTGEINLILSAAAGGAAITLDFAYFPGLPVMGIDQRELSTINNEQTVFFDTKYVYTYNGADFTSPSTVEWSGGDADFFWMANYRGSDPFDRLFFVTNFTNPAASGNNRIRYTSDLTTWTDFTPAVDSTNSIFQCKLIIPYYGRLLFLNTYEGTDDGMGTISANNYFNRCRFSQIGDPLQVDAWRSDTFGKGGFIDAPTSESIISCEFYKNTLIVFFERSAWELRYVGEYGLPFIWERISSDYGSESTFSIVLFDQGVLAVGDKAIVVSSGNTVDRIDLDIPDEVFGFHNEDSGKERIQGVRDFQKQLVFWSYSDAGFNRKFPNHVLVYNYANQTWAILRDNVTAFGVLTNAAGVNWDLPISWDSNTSWDTRYQGEFPIPISGNQQGFVHYYNFVLDADAVVDNLIDFIEHESLFIKSITLNTSSNINLEITNHNLEEGEIIYIDGLNFIDSTTKLSVTTSINQKFYLVAKFVDINNIEINEYDFETNEYLVTSHDNIDYIPVPGDATYVGGGVVALFPKVNIITKDFNPYQDRGLQMKMSYTDFQTDATPNSGVTINLFVNSLIGASANVPFYNPILKNSWGQWGYITDITQDTEAIITSKNHGLSNGRELTIGYVFGMTEINGGIYTVTVIDADTFSINIDSSAFMLYSRGGKWWTMDFNPFQVNGCAYAWQRFYSNVFGQYVTYQITYNDQLMNDPSTHSGTFELNAMILYTKPSGRLAL